jgi:molybdate transport system permease protein
MPVDWFALWLSLRVAALATLVALPVGLWLAAWLANRPTRGRQPWRAVAVVPPTVLCYGVATMPAPEGMLALSETKAVAAAMLEAIPLLTLLGAAALGGVDAAYARVARSLGASGWRVFWRVSLPLALRPLLAAVALVYARVWADVGLTLLVRQAAR